MGPKPINKQLVPLGTKDFVFIMLLKLRSLNVTFIWTPVSSYNSYNIYYILYYVMSPSKYVISTLDWNPARSWLPRVAMPTDGLPKVPEQWCNVSTWKDVSINSPLDVKATAITFLHVKLWYGFFCRNFK